MHASPSHNYISMLEFRQFVVALNGKSYRDTKHIENGFSPPKHGSIAAPWKMSTVSGVFFFNGEYKIRRVESVTKKKKYSTGKSFEPYYYLNPPGLMGTLLIDANKEMSKYNN